MSNVVRLHAGTLRLTIASPRTCDSNVTVTGRRQLRLLQQRNRSRHRDTDRPRRDGSDNAEEEKIRSGMLWRLVTKVERANFAKRAQRSGTVAVFLHAFAAGQLVLGKLEVADAHAIEAASALRS